MAIAAGVLEEVAVRDAGLLAAGAARPWVTVFGDDAYPTAARVFHLLNGRDLTYTVDEAERLMLEAAACELDVPQIGGWLRTHSSPAS